MPSPYSLVDAAEAFVANIILKNGRNEVQIYHFSPRSSSSSSSDPIIDESQTKRFEKDHAIVCACWLNDKDVVVPLRKAPKRRASEVESSSNKTVAGNGTKSPPALLAVAFESGEVQVYSPFSDSAVATVQAPATVVSLTQSSNENCFWALTDARAMEFNAFDGTVKRTVRLGKVDKDLHTIHYSPFKVKTTSHKSKSSESILAASAHLYLFDGTKSKKSFVAQYADADDDERAGSISHVLALESDDLAILVCREGSSTVALYDLEDPAQKPSTWDCKSRNISGLRSLTENLVAVFTDVGTEILTIKDDVLDSRVSTIRTNFKHIFFTDMISSDSHGVVGIWYDENEPRFERVSSDPSFEGDMKINIHYQAVADEHVEENAPEITFVADAEDEFEHDGASAKIATPTELYFFLRDLLTVKNVSRKKVLTLCSRNSEEVVIRETIRHFSQSEQCSTMVINLFQLVIREVSKDPTRKTPFALWLKWILLAHGGFISKQPEQEDNLRALKESLVQGMGMMPKLLALQGRLQLLKSQADLRSKTSLLNLDEDDEVDAFNAVDNDFGNDTTNNTTVFEDSVMYANGENDEFEGDNTINGTIVYENGEADEMDETTAMEEDEA